MAYFNFEGKKGEESTLRTNVKSNELYKAYADTQFEKNRKKNHKEIIEEINRRNLNDYGV